MSVLKVYKEVNNISKELQDSIPKMGIGKKMFYRLVNGVIDLHTGHECFGSKRSIRLHDVIFDPGKGEPVEIGVIGNISNGIPTFKKLHLGMDSGGAQLNPKIELIGGNPEHELIHAFLFLSNSRRGNPNRDTNAPELYELIDREAEAKIADKKGDSLFNAMSEARSFDLDTARMVAAAMGEDVTKMEPDEIKRAVRNFAMNKPDEFLALYGNSQLKAQADISTALKVGVIVYDHAGHRILDSEGKQLAALNANPDKNTVELFADWVFTHENGRNVLKSIVAKTKYILKKNDKDNPLVKNGKDSDVANSEAGKKTDE